MWMISLMACGSPSPDVPVEPEEATNAVAAPVDVDDPETCRSCHAAVVEEWTQSMHASAHHDQDPIHAGMRRLRMAKQGDQVASACAQCHTPRSVADVEAPAAKVGVACAGCHAAAEVHLDRGKGAKALVYGDALLGPDDLAPGASPAHATGPAPAHFTDGNTLCLACHGQTQTPSGLAACTTGPEHEAVEGAGTCVSCHMPQTEGPSGAVSTRANHASHRFHGPHDAWKGDASFLAEGLTLTATLRGPALEVSLTNLADHGFPTGFPGRMAWVSAEGRDAQGTVVWSSGPPTPVTLMNKVYVDADGTPTPPPFATALQADRRLEAHETRPFTFEVPPTVVTAEARVEMRLLPPPMAKKLSLADQPEGSPRTLTSVQAVRLR